MRIANPIYDVVFRYLMEDNKVARLLLSAILEKEIVELKFNTIKKPKLPRIVVTAFFMNFSATIKNATGEEEIVFINLFRAKYYFQILRFKKELKDLGINVTEEKDIPTLSIYILEEAFTQNEIPVVRVNETYIDVTTKEEIEEQHDFLKSLVNYSIIIQIPYLKGNRRTELEQLLEVFDQSNIVDNAGHFLEIDNETYPEKYFKIFWRLIKAISVPNIENNMDFESDIMEQFNSKDKAYNRSQLNLRRIKENPKKYIGSLSDSEAV